MRAIFEDLAFPDRVPTASFSLDAAVTFDDETFRQDLYFVFYREAGDPNWITRAYLTRQAAWAMGDEFVAELITVVTHTSHFSLELVGIDEFTNVTLTGTFPDLNEGEAQVWAFTASPDACALENMWDLISSRTATHKALAAFAGVSALSLGDPGFAGIPDRVIWLITRGSRIEASEGGVYRVSFTADIKPRLHRLDDPRNAWDECKRACGTLRALFEEKQTLSGLVVDGMDWIGNSDPSPIEGNPNFVEGTVSVRFAVNMYPEV